MPKAGLRDTVIFETQSPEATFRLGAAFGAAAQGGEVLALIGPLGAGKTQFVKGLAQGVGVPPENVTSPTFALMQSYAGRLLLTHIDLYRLENPDEICALGLEEEIEDAGLAAIEWADKGECLLPPGSLILRLKPLEGAVRKVEMQATNIMHAAWRDRSLKNAAEEREGFVTKAFK